MNGEHFYVPDPLLHCEGAKANPVYGYVPISGDNLPDLGDGVCQSTYIPVMSTMYTNEATYPHVHQNLPARGFHASPIPVVSLKVCLFFNN